MWCRAVLVAGWLVAALVLPIRGQAAEGGDPGVAQEYRIGAGDVLVISLWKNTDLTRVLQVLPDGTISFPLIGQIRVAEMTVAELSRSVEEKITPFSPEPHISVEVQQVNSLLVYVIGRVNNSGRFVLNSNINVLQALAMAGGLTPFAKRTEIKVFRTGKEGTAVYPFNYDAVSEGTALEQNRQLQRGDIIVVP